MRTDTTDPDLLPSDFFDGSSDRATVEGPRGSRADVLAEEDAPMAEAGAATSSSSSLPADPFQQESAPADVDADEWAAFQADVAAEAPGALSGAVVITAAPTLNGAASGDSTGQDGMEDDGKGEEEDAKQKLLDEFAEMESLEQRVLRLKERREALKSKHPITATRMEVVEVELGDRGGLNEEEDDEDEDNDDDDDFFRARGS